jgi:hypothetical protein
MMTEPVMNAPVIIEMILSKNPDLLPNDDKVIRSILESNSFQNKKSFAEWKNERKKKLVGKVPSPTIAPVKQTVVNSPSAKVEPPTRKAVSDPQRNIDAEVKRLTEEQLKIKAQKLEEENNIAMKNLQRKLEEEYQEKFKKLEESNAKVTIPAAPIPASTVHLYLPEVKVGDCIGEGSFGKVFIGEWSKIQVALKSFQHVGLGEVEKEISTFQ